MFADFQEFFFVFYSDALFVVIACLLVISIFLAITTVVKALDER
jgi:hypothetical protein